MFNRRAILASAIAVAAMAAHGSVQAQNANIAMKAELAEKGIDLNELAQKGRKGYKRPGPSGAAAAKRAARKRRNIRARASKRA